MMKETIDLLGKILTNILTALYGVVGRFGALCGDEGKKASVNYHNSRGLKWFGKNIGGGMIGRNGRNIKRIK